MDRTNISTAKYTVRVRWISQSGIDFRRRQLDIQTHSFWLKRTYLYYNNIVQRTSFYGQCIIYI